jgi:hypothetical protein
MFNQNKSFTGRDATDVIFGEPIDKKPVNT